MPSGLGFTTALAPIGLVSAMPQELASIVHLMQGEPTLVGSRVFWRANWMGHDVVAVCSGIGKVAAATTVALLIERFKVREVVFSGVAGGLGEGVNIGDVVVAQSLLQHDFDASPLFARHVIPHCGLSHFESSAVQHRALLKAAQMGLPSLGQALHQEPWRALKGWERAQVHEGLVLSGDRFIHGVQPKQALLAQLPHALAVEMEGAAAAQVCRDFELPFALVRIISDRADETASMDFQAFVNEVAAPYGAAVLQSYLKERC